MEKKGRVEDLLSELPHAGRIRRKDQDLAFNHPWEVRVLGLAVELYEQGHFTWPDFQASLIHQIDRWERRELADGGEWSYYHCWLEALENLLEGRSMVAGTEIDVRTQEILCAKPSPGHRA